MKMPALASFAVVNVKCNFFVWRLLGQTFLCTAEPLLLVFYSSGLFFRTSRSRRLPQVAEIDRINYYRQHNLMLWYFLESRVARKYQCTWWSTVIICRSVRKTNQFNLYTIAGIIFVCFGRNCCLALDKAVPMECSWFSSKASARPSPDSTYRCCWRTRQLRMPYCVLTGERAEASKTTKYDQLHIRSVLEAIHLELIT